MNVMTIEVPRLDLSWSDRVLLTDEVVSLSEELNADVRVFQST